MKSIILASLVALAVVIGFQNCDSGFETIKNLESVSNESSVGDDGSGDVEDPPVISDGFLLQLNSANLSDRFYSLRNVSDDEVVMAGQSEGYTANNSMEALFSFYNKKTLEQTVITVDTDDYHDQFFHMGQTPSGKFLASGIARTSFFSGSSNTWSNDGLIVQLEPTTKTVDWIKVVSRPIKPDGLTGYDDIIRGVHEVGSNLYLAAETGPGYPNDASWGVFVGALSKSDNSVPWAKLVDHSTRLVSVRKTQILEGNSIVIFGSTQTYNGTTRTGSYSLVARFDLQGNLMWSKEWASSGLFNGVVTSDNKIVGVGHYNGNGQVVIIDKDGVLEAAKQLSSTVSDNFFGVGEMQNGDLVISGSLRSAGYQDSFHDAGLIRVSGDLSLVRWSRIYGNPNTHDRIENSHNIIEGPNGEIAVSGFTSVDPSDNNNDDAFAFQIAGDGSLLAGCTQFSIGDLTLSDLSVTLSDPSLVITDLTLQVQDVDVGSNTNVMTSSGSVPEVICSGEI